MLETEDPPQRTSLPVDLYSSSLNKKGSFLVEDHEEEKENKQRFEEIARYIELGSRIIRRGKNSQLPP